MNVYGNKEPPPLAPKLRNGKPITIATVKDRECRWIIGPASAKSQMCGHPIATGKSKSWCEYHVHRGYQKAQPR